MKNIGGNSGRIEGKTEKSVTGVGDYYVHSILARTNQIDVEREGLNHTRTQ